MALGFASISIGAAPKKKKVPPPPPQPPANIMLQVQLKKALDGAEEKVGACVMESAPAGAFSLAVRAQITINHAGQLMGTTLSFKPEIPAAEKMRKCLEGVLQGLTYPKSLAPLVNAEREWSFEVK